MLSPVNGAYRVKQAPETDTLTLIEGGQNLFDPLVQAFDTAQILIH